MQTEITHGPMTMHLQIQALISKTTPTFDN